MTADLVERLLAEADFAHSLIAEAVAERRDYLAQREALLREAASALRSSGEAVAYVTREGNLIGGLVWTDAGRNADLPNGTKLYLHPATVTDEDVERAMEQYLVCMHNRAKNRDAMRAALESFVRPAPPTSTKGG